MPLGILLGRRRGSHRQCCNMPLGEPHAHHTSLLHRHSSFLESVRSPLAFPSCLFGRFYLHFSAFFYRLPPVRMGRRAILTQCLGANKRSFILTCFHSKPMMPQPHFSPAEYICCLGVSVFMDNPVSTTKRVVFVNPFICVFTAFAKKRRKSTAFC